MNRRVLPTIGAALVVGVLIDVPLDRPPFPGYGALIGLLGCIFLILVAKKLLAPWLDRNEDHYSDDVAPDVQHDVWGVRADASGSQPAEEPADG